MAREIRMIFTYMNLDPVWETFCDTYNGILTHLEAFDTWYPTVTGVQSSLATEWPLYIRRELNMVVTNVTSNLKVLNQFRKPAGALYTRRWNTIMAVNGGEIQKVKLDRTDICRNLPASTLGPFTG
jgi:chitinase